MTGQRLLLPLALAALLQPLACRAKKPSTPVSPAKDAKNVPISDPTDPPLPGLTSGAALKPEYLAALRKKGSDYKPRSEHLRDDGSPEFINRLIFESSPYLLQHAHNPVNWYPWGDAAFERARREGKLVIMSIGYSTCHWCHVMERESFEDLEIAAYMNQNFIAVKVDREERPDVDSAYMAAVNMLTGRGGWPMTTVLTPDRQVVFGGTYFPPRDGFRGARVGFLTILQKLAQEYSTDKSRLVQQAKSLSVRMAAAAQPSPPGAVPGAEVLSRTATAMARSFDARYGGFGRAPKFPRPVALDFLARYGRRTKDAQALTIVTRTLKGMADGGMNDQVGGGFHRYSTDEKWLVPHFEKMLYDNAQLAVAYVEGYQLTGDAEFARVARKTLDYVAREMTHSRGGFYSATDADSPLPGKGAEHNEEGLFFTWTPDEVDAVLGAETLAAKAVLSHFGIEPGGNFEGRSIPYIRRPLADTAKALGKPVAEVGKAIDEALPRMYDVRRSRLPPLRDDKIITAWNALMISAFAKAGEALAQPKYVKVAERAADFLLGTLRQDGVLYRTWLEGSSKLSPRAFLDDYAFLVYALLDLFEASQNKRWLVAAMELQVEMDQKFWDTDGGGYFFTANDAERLGVREKPDYDGAEPAGNSYALLNLLRLQQFTGDHRYRDIAERAFAVFSGTMQRAGRAVPKMLCALDYYLDEPLQVIIVLPDASAADTLSPVVAKTFLPNRVLLRGTQAELAKLASIVPLVQSKVARGGKATAYVCRRQVCDLPTSDPAILATQLAVRKPASATSR